MLRKGFDAAVYPTNTSGPRQVQLPNNRNSVNSRKLVSWLIPNGSMVQMYVNPESIQINYKKTISSTRTKGGFTLQYFGEDLIPISITGTTASSGIEGINVLRDVYRSEQLTFEPYAMALAAQNDEQANAANDGEFFKGLFGSSSLQGQLGSFNTFLQGKLGEASGLLGNVPEADEIPTLAEFAFTVEMYWSGEVYRGYFETFDFSEKANELGLFSYNIKFIATQKRGFRQNFLAWHRSATSGPSNSHKIHGVPYSFNPDGNSTGGTAAPLVKTQSAPSDDILSDVNSLYSKLF